MRRSEKRARLALRPLSAKDERLVFGWRNDPFIVERSTSRRRVRLDEHRRWFRSILDSDRHAVMIVTLGRVPVGQVRFDRESGKACVISVYLLESYTGRRLGVRAIRMGCRMIARRWPVRAVRACVRGDNLAGQSAFLKAGFAARRTAKCPADHREYRLRFAAPGAEAGGP